MGVIFQKNEIFYAKSDSEFFMPKILLAFNLTPPSASLAYGLRKIYRQYLEVSLVFVFVNQELRHFFSLLKNCNYTERNQIISRKLKKSNTTLWAKFRMWEKYAKILTARVMTDMCGGELRPTIRIHSTLMTLISDLS